MTSPAMTRPSRVTTACLFAGLSCLMLLLFVATTLADWGSIEVREQITNVLANGTLNPQDLTAEDVMGWLRIVLMGVAAVAASGIIFAIHASRGHQPSRIILTVLCVLAAPLFLIGGGLGVIAAVFAIFCATYLWTAEARQWFAVMNGATPPTKVAEAPKPDHVSTSSGAASLEAGPAAQPASRERPDGVLIAILIALIMSSLVALVCGFNALAYLVSRSDYLSILNDNAMMREAIAELGMTAAEFARLIFVACAIATVLAIAAVAASGAALARKESGRVALVILAAVTVPLSIFALPFGLLWTAAAIATLVLLRRPDARSWFASS